MHICYSQIISSLVINSISLNFTLFLLLPLLFLLLLLLLDLQIIKGAEVIEINSQRVMNILKNNMS